MGDQAGRKYPPRRTPHKMAFDTHSTWWFVVSLLAIAALTSFSLVTWL